MYQAGDVRVTDVPDPVLQNPTDAIVRVTSACICGSDLWPYQSLPATSEGRRMGHEFIGIVEEVGKDVTTVTPGDLVVAPFGAVTAGVKPGHTVTVIGDGAVGLCGVLAARRLGAEQIVLMGRHRERTDLGREFGATELTRGDGTHAVLECVGTLPSIETAVKIARAGGAISRIGVPQYTEGPLGFDTVFRNVKFTGGAAPARAYIEELMPDILDGTVEPGKVFDRTVGLDEVPDGYKAMAARESLKVLIQP